MSMKAAPALLGQPDATGRTSLIQQDNGRSGSFGYRSGNWKLIRHDSGRTSNLLLRLKRHEVPKFQLFDLSKDPEEKINLIDKYPKIATRMKNELHQIIQ